MSKCKEEDEQPDYFGFTKEYSRKSDYPVTKAKPIKMRKIIMRIGIVFGIIISILLMILSGYIAYNSFTNDPGFMKIAKTSVAVLFYPFYLFYIFVKNVIFQVP